MLGMIKLFLKSCFLAAKGGVKGVNVGQRSNLPQFWEIVCRYLLLNLKSDEDQNYVGRYLTIKTCAWFIDKVIGKKSNFIKIGFLSFICPKFNCSLVI